MSLRMIGSAFVVAVAAASLTPTEVLAQAKPVPRELLEQLQRSRGAEMAKRREEAAKLLEELAAKDFASLTAEEYAGGAQAAFDLRKFDEAARFADAAVAKDPANIAMRKLLIQSLCNLGKPADAEKAHAAALAAHPDAAELKALHRDVATSQMRAKQFAEALPHLRAYLDMVRPTGAAGENTSAYISGVRQLLTALGELKDQPQALAAIDAELAALPEGSASVEMTLLAQKAVALQAAGKTADAQALLDAAIAEARKSLEAKPDDLDIAKGLIQLMQSSLEVASEEKAPALRKEMMEFLLAQLKAHSSSPEWLQLCLNPYQMEVMNVAREARNDEAVEYLTALSTALDAIEPADEKMTALLDNAKRGIASVQSRIEADRLRQELVGKPMIQPEVTAWVNGTPLAAADLQGKVVVLDFWAVWCGPCIATFPHLKEWQEKYADKGLVMIGLTKNYGYGWDDEAKRPAKPTEKPTAEEELAALEKFATHHELKHRLAVMPDGSELSKQYGVTGIPQIVVIDQKGIIRLIRVGSGEANAHDVEAMLEELLGGTQAN